MERMKTFFIYFLLFAGFFVLSNVLEYGLIRNMYSKIEGGSYSDDTFTVEVSEAKATSVNGYMDVKIKNNSNEDIDEAYAKIDLVDEYGNVVSTEYTTIRDLKAGESKNLKVKFEGRNIKGCKVEMVPEIPDRSNIINLFGWEFDSTNFLGTGINLTSFHGIDLTKYINLAKKYLVAGGNFLWGIANTVPMWAYIVASMIVVWYI